MSFPGVLSCNATIFLTLHYHNLLAMNLTTYSLLILSPITMEWKGRRETEELNLTLLFISRLGLYDQNAISAKCIGGIGHHGHRNELHH